jgi:hypothetical protein
VEMAPIYVPDGLRIVLLYVPYDLQ